ncbi:MAG: SUMF1/EgtB/PvdO family nonheme iron enzyme [Verrucomicrobiales bacterium]
MTRTGFSLALLWALAALTHTIAAEEVDFATQVKPILEAACVHCHGEANQKGDFRIDKKEDAFKTVDGEAMIVPGRPDQSKAYTTTVLPADHDDIMPPAKDEPPLATVQTELLKAWIASGAKWPQDVTLEPKPRLNFVQHIQPLLEMHCVACHNPEKLKGEYDLTTPAGAFKGGETKGTGLVAFHSEKSALFTSMTRPPDDDDLMPPRKNGGPLTPEHVEKFRLWIEQGAVWPDGLAPLKQREIGQDRPPNPDNLELVRKIHAGIVAVSTERSEDTMKSYENIVPRTGAKYAMVPIKGGHFLMGSAANSSGCKPDESPQVKVQVDPFWMGKFEVTWDEYLPFQVTPVDRYKDGAKKTPNPSDEPPDVVSSPTAPYQEMSFGMGQDGFPAIAMTEHAALKYCEWLSAQTGHFYRLPTEAEWEYACRAGTTTAYSFGDDPAQLTDYGWFFDNSGEGVSNNQYHKIGTRKPNPWGLHDMHGNVLEWVLDQYDGAGYKKWAAGVSNPWEKPVTLWGRACRGGSWDDDALNCRSAARRASIEQWKQQDPQLPKSMWYLTDARWIGLRLVRPLRVPSPQEMFYIWNCGRPEELAKTVVQSR